MHPLLVGGNPFTTTSIYGLILYLEKKWGIHYSMGGTGQIINGLEKLMEEENIEIIRDNEVQNIIVTNNKINGLKLKNGNEIKADNIIYVLFNLNFSVITVGSVDRSFHFRG